ncbi:glycosyltransferase family 4 protein [Halosimplex marinum]|uniref:glycosyltransferase family 4 protein n=1 Tax=Halosimplex marinum TaxID=3396620 RepID=UPI003F54C4BB
MSSRSPSTSRRSVLFVHHREISSPYSATVPHYLAREVSRSHAVHVLSRRRSGDDEHDEFPDDVVHHEVATGSVPILSGLLFVAVSTLYAAVLGARYRYDAVYAFQQTIIQGWAAARAGSSRLVVGLQSVPVRQKRDLSNAAHEHRSVSRRVRVVMKSQYARAVGLLLGRADEVVCLTDGIRELTEREYGVDLSEAHVIGMGVDTERFDIDADRERARGPDDTWVVTYVGSVGPPRGLEHVLDALAETDRDVALRVAGGGDDDYMASLRERARDLGVDDRVTWLGIVPHEEVPELLAETDVAVSSLADIESYRVSFPAKLLEYMAAGSTVVATDIPAHRRLVEPGENGLLYDGTAAGLADALDDVVGGAVDPRALGRAARATAEAHDWDAVVAEHEAVLFDRTVRRPRTRSVPA